MSEKLIKKYFIYYEKKKLSYLCDVIFNMSIFKKLMINCTLRSRKCDIFDIFLSSNPINKNIINLN